MAKKFDVVSIGSSLRDIFLLNKDMKCADTGVCHPFNPEVAGDKIGVKKMYFDIGGGGSNTAVTFANMGLKAGFFSQIGDDLAGKEVLKVMKGFKVDTGLVNIKKGEETGYSVIFIDKGGDRTALVYRGAAAFEKNTKLPKEKMKSDWFFITSLGGNEDLLKKVFSLAKQNKTKIAWNPGSLEIAWGHKKIKPFLKSVDVLFVNFKEAQQLAGTKSKDIKKIFSGVTELCPKAIICITGAKKGAWIKNGVEIIWAGILDKTVVNATGAGDAFGSGFVSGLMIYKNDIAKSLQLAILNSNQVVTKMGAKHGLLKKPPTEKILNQVKIKEIR